MPPRLRYFTTRRIDRRAELVLKHLQQTPVSQLSLEVTALLRLQTAPAEVPALRAGPTHHCSSSSQRRISSTSGCGPRGEAWIRAAHLLCSAGDWERALVVANRLLEQLDADPSCADHLKVQRIHRQAMQLAPSVLPKPVLTRSTATEHSRTPTPLDEEFNGTKKFVQKASPTEPFRTQDSLYERQEETVKLLAQRKHTRLDQIVCDILDCHHNWEQLGHTPRRLNGNCSTARRHPLDGSAARETVFFDVIGYVKKTLSEALSRSGHTAAKDEHPVSLALQHAALSNPRATAILLRDERFTRHLFRCVDAQTSRLFSSSVERRAATTEGHRSEWTANFVLHVSEVLLRALTPAHFQPQQHESIKSSLKYFPQGVTGREEVVALHNAIWRALSNLWKLLSSSVSNDLSPITMRWIKRCEEELLPSLLKALWGLQQCSAAASIDSSAVKQREDALTLKAVRDFTNGLCTVGVRFTSVTLGVGAPRSPVQSFPWTWNFLVPLLSLLHALRIPPGSAVAQAVLLQWPVEYNSSPEDFLDAESKLCSIIKVPDTSRDVTSWCISFALQSPNERWREALQILASGHQAKAVVVTAAHLRTVLSSLRTIGVSTTWEQALRCTDYIMSTFPALHRPRGPHRWGGLDAATQVTLMMNLKCQHWERAFDVLQHCGPPTPQTSDAVNPSLWCYGPLMLRQLHLVLALNARWDVSLQWFQRLKGEMQGPPFFNSPPSLHFMHYLYSLYAAATSGQVQLCEQLYFCLPAALFHPQSHAGVVSGKAVEQRCPQNAITAAVAGLGLLDHQYYEEARVFARAAREEMLSLGRSSTPSPLDSWTVLTLEFLALLHSEKFRELEEWLREELCIDVHSSPPDRCSPEEAKSSGKTAFSQVHRDVQLGQLVSHSYKLVVIMGLKRLQAPFRLLFSALSDFSEKESVHKCSERQNDSTDTRRGSHKAVAGSLSDEGRGQRVPRRAVYVPPGHQAAQLKKFAVLMGKFCRVAEVSPAVVEEVARHLSQFEVGDVFLQVVWTAVDQ